MDNIMKPLDESIVAAEPPDKQIQMALEMGNSFVYEQTKEILGLNTMNSFHVQLVQLKI
jgi:hypothetical protein